MEVMQDEDLFSSVDNPLESGGENPKNFGPVVKNRLIDGVNPVFLKTKMSKKVGVAIGNVVWGVTMVATFKISKDFIGQFFPSDHTSELNSKSQSE